MTQEHPITPPSEDRVLKWSDEWFEAKVKHMTREKHLCMQAARWGADQELEELLTFLRVHHYDNLASDLLAARRPKPPSLKEQALGALYAIATGADDTREFHQDIETIKSALEQLDD
jgi:hypothetical protein